MSQSNKKLNPREQLMQKRSELMAQINREKFLLDRRTQNFFGRNRKTLTFSERFTTAMGYAFRVGKVLLPFWQLKKRWRRRA